MTFLIARKAAQVGKKKSAIKGEVARACKISSPSVYCWLNGKTHNLVGLHLNQAAQYFGVMPTWIQTGRGPMEAADDSAGAQAVTNQAPDVKKEPRTEAEALQDELLLYFSPLSIEGKKLVLARAFKIHILERPPTLPPEAHLYGDVFVMEKVRELNGTNNQNKRLPLKRRSKSAGKIAG